MKLNGIFYLIITTVILVTLTVMSYYDLSYSLIFFITIGGQLVFIFTVFKILTDKYTTDKTFDDWYEDEPIEKDNS